jgi:hypothetical protein
MIRMEVWAYMYEILHITYLKDSRQMITVFWDVTPCSQVNVYQTTRRKFPYDSNLHSYCREHANSLISDKWLWNYTHCFFPCGKGWIIFWNAFYEHLQRLMHCVLTIHCTELLISCFGMQNMLKWSHFLLTVLSTPDQTSIRATEFVC